MTAPSDKDPLIIAWILSTAMGKGEQRLRADLQNGRVPPEDTRAPLCPRTCAARGWRLSTIRAWNPAVADRCAAILAALDSLPLKKAA